jgi:hypothetical protein
MIFVVFSTAGVSKPETHRATASPVMRLRPHRPGALKKSNNNSIDALVRSLVESRILYVALHSEVAGILFVDLVEDNRRLDLCAIGWR